MNTDEKKCFFFVFSSTYAKPVLISYKIIETPQNFKVSRFQKDFFQYNDRFAIRYTLFIAYDSD